MWEGLWKLGWLTGWNEIIIPLQRTVSVKTTILGNLGNFCDEFLLRGRGKFLKYFIY